MDCRVSLTHKWAELTQGERGFIGEKGIIVTDSRRRKKFGCQLFLVEDTTSLDFRTGSRVGPPRGGRGRGFVSEGATPGISETERSRNVILSLNVSVRPHK